MTRLTDVELREVLARAEEIQRASQHGAETGHEIEAVIGAAEELGLERRAVELALRERLGFLAAPPPAGTLAFARSVDGKFYVAEVKGPAPDGVRVRFLRGSEHVVRLDELKQFSLVPGERVSVHWPWWGPWNCTVVAYDPVRQRVKLNDGWGYTKSFPLAAVWSRATPSPAGSRTRVYVTLIGVGAGLGALLGSVATALLLR